MHPAAAPAAHRFGLTYYRQAKHRGSVQGPSATSSDIVKRLRLRWYSLTSARRSLSDQSRMGETKMEKFDRITTDVVAKTDADFAALINFCSTNRDSGLILSNMTPASFSAECHSFRCSFKRLSWRMNFDCNRRTHF